MQIEFDTNYKTFQNIPRNSVFIWRKNGKVYVKIDSDFAIDLETQTDEGFDLEDEVTPCVITKIVLKK